MRIGAIALTALTIAGAVGLVIAGKGPVARLAAQTAPVTAAEPVAVTARRFVVEDGYTVSRRFLGQVEPRQSADLSFELNGRVVEILVEEGDRVAAGSVLARLDTALLDTERAQLAAQRRALQAQLDFAEASLQRRTALRERGFSPDEAFDRAQSDRDALTAQLAETEAALASVQVRLEKSVLLAPFEGHVGARAVDAGATVAPGQAVLGLLETGAPRVRVGLPLWVDPAAHAEATIEIAGIARSATLIAVRPDIDPATRTRTALYALAGDAAPGNAVFGETAALRIERRIAARGAWVPVASLREGRQGVWTVLVADGEGVVRALAVEILHAEADRAYVAGAFPGDAVLIEAGPHRVTPGQHVRLTGEG